MTAQSIDIKHDSRKACVAHRCYWCGATECKVGDPCPWSPDGKHERGHF